MPFERLFSPLTLKGVTIRNRIASTGHNTRLAWANVANEALAAYHAERAKGGAGLILTEGAVVHETGRHLSIANDSDIKGFRLVTDAVHPHGAKVFGQLFHPGREMSIAFDGTKPITHAPSAIPNERFHAMPRAMPKRMVREFVSFYGAGARRYREAGMDGCEVLASQGYGIGQFLNEQSNQRHDRYGGSFENRLRFVVEIAQAVRASVGDDFPIGIRISGDELNPMGMKLPEVVAICAALDAKNCFDYYNIIAGSSTTLGAAIHIVPPMAIKNGYVAPFAAAVRAKITKPVLVAGRINQPQIAEDVLASGQADIIGMTRAMIADPKMPMKAREGRAEDIRACIACNQACIGHMHLGYPISCIQHPESGRELRYPDKPKAAKPRKIMVVGGGPGGLKAAAVAAERGHDVTLYERGKQVGGQVLLAQLLPGRTEFGGIITNLTHEAKRLGAKIVTHTDVTADFVKAQKPDAVILATGATPRMPEILGAEDAHVVNAWQVLRGEANVGGSVVVADWRCDWIGLGIAEKLARDGRRVRLCVNGYMAGQNIQAYVRDHWLGILHGLGVQIIPMARLAGVDSNTVYLEHVSTDAPFEVSEVETLVTSLGHDSDHTLEDALTGSGIELHLVGDCASPRTAEEAVLEGLQAGLKV